MMRPRRALALASTVAAITGGATAGPAAGSGDRDARHGTAAPTSEQRERAVDLGTAVRWNRFGTPTSVLPRRGWLATRVRGRDAASAARAWAQRERTLLGLTPAHDLEVIHDEPFRGTNAYAVVLRQRFGGLSAAVDGLLTVGVRGSRETGWKVAYASTSLTRSARLAGDASLSAQQAWARAAGATKLGAGAAIEKVTRKGEWTLLEVGGLRDVQRARLLAAPTPRDGVRPAWEIWSLKRDASGETASWRTLVDAITGKVLLKEDNVHQYADNPRWKTFPAYPPMGGQTSPWDLPNTDTRQTWCWTPAEGCDRSVSSGASPLPWDVDPATKQPTRTTSGNNAQSAEAWFSPLSPGGAQKPVSASRDYLPAWSNAWFANSRGCSQTNFRPGGNDIDAATANLFVGHNRMHDWTYHLGFTEERWNAQQDNFEHGERDGDPLIGDAQAGAVVGGFPSYLGRDNANMITLPDGTPSITNMYLWQPIAGAFYAPCVDGDYDMAVIGHEFGHMVENRMIGKGNRRSGHHAGAMGESNGDLLGVEYLNEHGFAGRDGENPFSVGAYVTGNKDRAIRNYGMNFPRTGAFPEPSVSLVKSGGPLANPLNFSNIGYDITGPQVHADGEIWSATNYDVRQALADKYAGEFPASDTQRQTDCAEGRVPADQCPGNRRWAQIMFDAYLLMPSNPSMLDARDAYLAADRLRFGGANQAELWLAFARRGFGADATASNDSRSDSDSDPKPDFRSPLDAAVPVTFRVSGDRGRRVPARVYVGHYEARTSPVADTDPATGPSDGAAPGDSNLDATAAFAAGTYEFVVTAPGHGHARVRQAFSGDDPRTVKVRLTENHAAAANGAKASGDGVQHEALIDETERTSWDVTGSQPDVRGRAVTVDLAGGTQTITRVNVSALLEPGQNRFTALRRFRIDVSDDGEEFREHYTSPADAFPGFNPRPVAPEMIMRSFEIPRVRASHVRLVVLDNQCTGNAAFHGDQDGDPANGSDCRQGSPGTPTVPVFGDLPQVVAPRDNEVHVAELQVFGS